jgi:hypothetical protein
MMSGNTQKLLRQLEEKIHKTAGGLLRFLGAHKQSAHIVSPEQWNAIWNRARDFFAETTLAEADMCAALLAHASDLVIDVDGVHSVYVDAERNIIDLDTEKHIKLGTPYGAEGFVSWDALRAFVKAPGEGLLGVDAYTVYRMYLRLAALLERIAGSESALSELSMSMTAFAEYINTVHSKHAEIRRDADSVSDVLDSFDTAWLRFTDDRIILIQPERPTQSQLAALGDMLTGKGVIWIDAAKIGGAV